MRRSPRLKIPLVFLAILVAHLSLLSEVRVAGVAPDAMLLLAIVGGIVGGPASGAIVGFTSGVVLDLFLQTPLGLSALAFSVVGYVVGSVQGGVLRTSWWIPLVTAFFASAAGVALYALSGTLIGEPNLIGRRLLLIVVVVGAFNTVLAPVALRVLRWALDTGSPRTAYR